MSINIRYPNITASSEKEQIAQIRSYLHQLVNQLNYELPNIGSGDGTAKSTDTKSTQTYEVQGTEVSYYELRSLIVQDLQKVDAMIEDLEKSKANGEFDGEQGPPGEQGLPGSPGEPGEKGERGFSPSVEVEEIEGGHHVTITDVEGDKEFDVMDGKDSVNETGTANGWTYTKLASGIYEMFGEFHVTTTEPGTAIGSMYSSEVLTLPTPFAISSAIVYGSSSDYFMVINAGTAIEDAENNISFALLRPETFDAETEVTVRLHATGIFDQGGTE